jgi:crotonobetainyl-CoA:carnitine CoA-transferase CaiB-like acyl-CoA transferase
MKSLGSPLKLSATPTNPRRAPMLGEHTEEMLRDSDFSPAEISALRTSGAIR